MNKHKHFDTKEESKAAMLKAAKHKKGDEILICRDDDESTCYHKEALWFVEKHIAGGIFKVRNITNHTGTWSGTWKYSVGKTKKPWGATGATHVDFGAASEPGKCSSCVHRLARLAGGPGACPGIYRSKEEGESSE